MYSVYCIGTIIYYICITLKLNYIMEMVFNIFIHGAQFLDIIYYSVS